MSYDEALNMRIMQAVAGWENTAHKKMFGGVCHLLRGNMFCGVYKEFLILRLGEEAAADALEQEHVNVFDITGKPMRGWVMVGPESLQSNDTLRNWLAKAKAFAETLPPKKTAVRRLGRAVVPGRGRS